ncbi:hypothetical protein [Burkholderia sp. L27(2015)]|nr:hypothetical protein [Burkholderia sp. L27(2015)]
MIAWLKGQGAKRIAIVSDDAYFNNANSQSFFRLTKNPESNKR